MKLKKKELYFIDVSIKNGKSFLDVAINLISMKYKVTEEKVLKAYAMQVFETRA